MSNLQYNKFWVALVTAAATAVTLGLANGDAAKWVSVALAFAGALGVYAVKNETTDKPISEQILNTYQNSQDDGTV